MLTRLKMDMQAPLKNAPSPMPGTLPFDPGDAHTIPQTNARRNTTTSTTPRTLPNKAEITGLVQQSVLASLADQVQECLISPDLNSEGVKNVQQFSGEHDRYTVKTLEIKIQLIAEPSMQKQGGTHDLTSGKCAADNDAATAPGASGHNHAQPLGTST